LPDSSASSLSMADSNTINDKSITIHNRPPKARDADKKLAHSLIGHPVHRVELKAEPVGHAHFTSDLADVLGNLASVQRWFLDNVSALQNFEDRYKGRTDWPILPINLLSAQD